MTASDLAPWVYGLYGAFFTLLITIFFGGYWLRGKLGKIDNLRSPLSALGDELATQIQLTGVIIGGLRRQKVLGDTELIEIEKTYVKGHIDAIRHIIKQETETNNPLNPGQLSKLNYYISKAEMGELFTHEEIKEYNELVSVLKKDKGSVDPGVVALIGLGALLLGIWLGSKN